MSSMVHIIFSLCNQDIDVITVLCLKFSQGVIYVQWMDPALYVQNMLWHPNQQ